MSEASQVLFYLYKLENIYEMCDEQLSRNFPKELGLINEIDFLDFVDDCDRNRLNCKKGHKSWMKVLLFYDHRILHQYTCVNLFNCNSRSFLLVNFTTGKSRIPNASLPPKASCVRPDLLNPAKLTIKRMNDKLKTVNIPLTVLGWHFAYNRVPLK